MLEELKEIAKKAGAIILSATEIKESTELKTSHRDLVTKYDKLVERTVKKDLLALLPEAAFFGEEEAAPENLQSAEWLFVVDPIDGTTNFVQGFHNSCVSIGLMHFGKVEYGVVYDPYYDELFSAKRGDGAYLNGKRLTLSDRDLMHSLAIFGSAIFYPEITQLSLRVLEKVFLQAQDVRRFGAAALDLCYIAAGRAGVFFECRICPWDYCAGSLIAQEAGAVVTALSGKPLDLYHKCSVLAGVPTAYREVLSLAAPEMEKANQR
ncbi:MAG: inositol monophosphatase [Clostridia bacterium]|nr:inositol monophosphatase [Clostridia bacterium]